MHRMGLHPFLTFCIDAMLNFDGDVDANADANVKCEHTLLPSKDEFTLILPIKRGFNYTPCTYFRLFYGWIDKPTCRP